MIVKGMYGLPQAGKIANDLLKYRLPIFGYYATNYLVGSALSKKETPYFLPKFYPV